MRGNTDQRYDLCADRRKEGVTSCNTKKQRTGGTNGRKQFTRIALHPQIEIKRIASNKIKDIWPKIGQYLIEYKKKWKRVLKE
jgi:hypothetical protein